MSTSNYALSQWADAWDKEKRQSEKILEEWVQDNPQWWAIGLATATKSAMDLGAGFVDVLRFGEGMAEGGLKGAGKDVLRLLSILGPLGRAGGWAASKFVNIGAIRLAVAVKGVTGPCTFQAVNNAMSIVKGKSLFITVRDMAKALGKPLRALAKNEQGKTVLGSWVDDLVPVMRDCGATVKEVGGLARLDQVAQLAKRDNVVIFAFRTTVKTMKDGREVLKEIKHSIIAVRSPILGRVRFADYGGKFFDSIEEMARRWGQVVKPIELYQKNLSAAVVQGSGVNTAGPISTLLERGTAVVIEGITAIETVEAGVEFAIPVEMVAAPAAPPKEAPPEVVRGAYEAFKERKAGKKVIRLPEMVIKAGAGVAPRADTLKGVQFRLNALGFGAGPVDGIVGPRTRRAVRAFQEAYPPLQPDAVPGPKTQEKLVEVCGY